MRRVVPLMRAQPMLGVVGPRIAQAQWASTAAAADDHPPFRKILVANRGEVKEPRRAPLLGAQWRICVGLSRLLTGDDL